MTRLTIYPDNPPLTPEFDSSDVVAITDALRRIGVRFERWPATRPLSRDANDQEVLEVYAADIERLRRENAYQSVDVARCRPGRHATIPSPRSSAHRAPPASARC